MSYIYLNLNDLSEDKQSEIREIAREEVAEETTKAEADDLRMTLEDLIDERVDQKLLTMSHAGRFVFNI